MFLCVLQSLRDLTAEVAKLDPSATVRFAAAEGLGKIVLSNIRTPKVLMDLSSASETNGDKAEKSATGSGSDDAKAAKPLEQEPLLAARIMVEDCMNLLLDVDDIDRCFASAAARGAPVADAEQMSQRRALLVAGITSSFRLPSMPAAVGVNDAAGGGSSNSDGVFLRIMGLPKGRTLLARTLRVLMPAAGAEENVSSATSSADTNPHLLLWAFMRNAIRIFGAPVQGLDPSSERSLLENTHKLAGAARQAVLKLSSAQHVVDVLTAFVTGTKQHIASLPSNSSPMDAAMLPLANTRSAVTGTSSTAGAGHQEWLGEVLQAVVQRADQLGREDMPWEWQQLVSSLVGLVLKHLEVLQMVHAAAAASNNSEALALVVSLTCKPLVHALSGHTSEHQRAQLRDLMLKLTI